MLSIQAKHLRGAGISKARARKIITTVHAKGDTPISIEDIYEISGLGDALYAMQHVCGGQEKERDRVARLFLCQCLAHVS